MKLSKKRIEEVAARLFRAWMDSDFVPWHMCLCQESFRRVARVALLELQPQTGRQVRWPKPQTLLRGSREKTGRWVFERDWKVKYDKSGICRVPSKSKPRSCKLVNGKAVCE